jgi:hypothetical protein
MDVEINSKRSRLLSKLNITSFLIIALVACGGGGGSGESPVGVVSDTTGDSTSDNTSDSDNVPGISNTSESYVTMAAQVYLAQSSLGGIYAVKPLFSKLALYYMGTGQEVIACENSGEKNTNAQKSGDERSLNPGDNLTVTYQQCDDGEGIKEGTSTIDIIENDEVSGSELRTIFDYVSNGTLNGAPKLVNMRIKVEQLGEVSVTGINSDRYETDGSFKGNPNTIDHPAPHYEDYKVRFSKMIIERYQNNSTEDSYLYWDIDVLDKENSTYSYTTVVLDDLRGGNTGLVSGRYSVIYQGDRIEVTIAGADNVQVILDRNNDGSVEEQQQMTNDQFIAQGFIIEQ